MTNAVNHDQGIDDTEVTKLIRPIISLVSAEANHIENEQIVMRKLEYIRAHARDILEVARTTYTIEDGDTNKSIFGILEGAFGPNIAGWSLAGKQSIIIKQFIDKLLAHMQAGVSRDISHAANESQINKIA